MKNFKLNLTGLHGSPNQTGETLTRENRLGIVTCQKPLRTLCITLLLLTLGVGQMWGNTVGFESEGNGIKYYYSGNVSDQSWEVGRDGATKDLGAITSLYLKEYWIKMYQESTADIYGQNYQHMYYKVHRQAVSAGSTGFTDILANWWNWNGDDGTQWRKPTGGNNNQNVDLLDGLGSGKYQMSFYFQQNGSSTWRCPSGSTNNTLKWTIAAPAMGTHTHSSDGTGNGASATPYLKAVGSTLRITITGTQASTDANSVLYVSFDNGSTYSSTNYLDIEISDATKRSVAIKAKYYNSADDLSGTVYDFESVYYQGTVSPSLDWAASDPVTPLTMVSGNDVTLSVVRSNTTNSITWEYTNNGTTWNSLTPKSTSNSGQTAVWTIPEANGATQTYQFRAKITADALTTSASSAVTVYGKKTIHVRNINDWETMKLFCYSNDDSREAWPGSITGVSLESGQWYIIELTSKWPYFILTDGTNQLKGDKTYTYASSVTNDGYYTISSGSGSSLTLTSTTAPAAPTVTTAAASSITTTSATLGGSVVVNRDKVTERGYYWSTNSALSSSNLGVGTKVTISGTNNTDGNFSQSKTGLTNGTTYYVIAYATNGFGTSYGSVVNFRTKFVTTVTLDKQSGTGGTSSVSATEGSDMPSATAPTRTGYTFGGYYASTGGSGTQYYNASMASAHAWDVAAPTATIYAKWTAKTYDVTLNANEGTGDDQIVVATYDAAMPTTIKTAGTAIVAPTRTGYNFAGYYDDPAAGTQYYTSALVSARTWDKTTATTLYAHWTPKQSALTIDKQMSAEGFGTAGTATASASATYGAAMPSLTGTLPTAAQGYAFMGFFDATGGKGTKYYNADGTSAATWDKDTESGTTLYAYYKKAEITGITLSATTVAPGASVTATPTIEPTPTGPTVICWKVLRSNNNLLEDLGSGNTKTFSAPSASGSYKVECILRTGTTCGAGTKLDSVVTDFVVAGAHTVTIKYQDGDGRTIAATTSTEGRPLAWSEDVTAPSITGYTFTRWDAGEGVLIKDGDTENTVSTSTANPIKIKANYDGTLTAVYSKKNILYFNNTLGWEHVYVYFYTNGNYWNSNKNNSGSTDEYVYGSGANTSTANYSGFYTGHYGEMTKIEGTNIFYFDYSAEGWSHTNYVTFTKDDQHNYEWFYNTEVVRLADASHYYNNPATLMMYVPLTTKYENRNKDGDNITKYYTEGYWMNYPENTGYTLKIFDGTGSGASIVHDIPFNFTSTKAMPMQITVELNANTTYGFKIYRNDGSWYGNGGTMKINASGDEGQAVWEFTTGASNNCGLKTSAAGDYTFTLTYGEKSAGNYYYLVGVHYPASVGSYRLVYKDLAEWSLGTEHTAAWAHPSRVIYKNEGVADTVSFFVAKGASPTIQIQEITTIDNEGNITWANVGSAVSYDTVSAAGVYNFITSQTASALSIDKVEPYTGNYYIRTDAVDGKWDNYRTGSDHLMTYSAFSESRETNKFGELFSHYKAKWCPRETNVKFCIANDYSSSISDTLTQDIPDTFNNINEGGWLNSQKNEGKSELQDKYSANIRFMWNKSTNKISRAYISSSTNADKKFLILKGGAEFWNSDNSNLSGTGESHANKEAIFKDNENWIYEREINVTTGTRFKLFACYAQDSPSESNAQYFRGAYDSGDIDDDDNSVILIGGDGTGTCNARLIYDFKTNRLIAAYLPSNSAVSGKTEIDADLMVIREHQDAGQQITFANSTSELDKVKTVYGVMRFNRWILNNRANPNDLNKEHCATDGNITTYHPLLDAGSQKSSNERGLYWISFPFDVNLSEVFGFGTYGTHWVVMRYNGEKRAKEGYWVDSEGFWEYIWDRTGVTLKAGMGYVLALDLDLMQATDRTFWNNEIQQVELYFPSTSTVGSITQTDAIVEVPEYKCTIDRTGNNGPDINKNRTKVDSDWNIIGVPSYANYGTALTDENGGTVTWKDNSSKNWTNDLPFLYEWNANDNTYTVQSGSTYAFKAMHAYYVQYHGTLTWSLASATPQSIVARRTYSEKPQSMEVRLELQQNEKMVDQTFVRLCDDEETSANFVFGEDMSKELNTGKANIYTFIENYVPAAGNSLPMSEQTTVVPVGVKVNKAGEYTFAMPEGTNGTGVVLVDTENGTRTNLALGDYTVALGAGTTDGRFVLEISPVANTPTGIDEVPSDKVPSTNVRKVMVDGVLYIVKDGKAYDARGTRVK